MPKLADSQEFRIINLQVKVLQEQAMTDHEFKCDIKVFNIAAHEGASLLETLNAGKFTLNTASKSTF